MRLEATVYCTILLSLCFCVSNGTPAKEVSGGRSNTPPNSKKYTDKEDESIVEELSSLLDIPNSHSIWSKITEKHNEKWRRKTPGFSQERSSSGLRNRFWGILIHNYPYVNVKVPESLLKKLGKENLNKMEEGTSSSQSTGPNLHIDSQEANEELEKIAWFEDLLVDPYEADVAEEFPNNTDVDKIISPRGRYTEEEDQFIIDELSVNLRDDSMRLHSRNLWKKIAENHSRKRKVGSPGFIRERTADSLHKRFRFHLMPSTKYTSEEDKFIVEELLKSSQTTIFGSSTIESIRAEHDKKREAKISGFENARTVRSLVSHIATLKNCGLLPPEVMKKLSARQRGVANARSGDASRVHRSGQTDSEIEEMILELLNNPEGENHFNN